MHQLTKRTLCVIALVPAALVLGCGNSHGPRPDGSRVDVTGDSPEEAADEVTDAICDWTAECGEPSIECGGSSAGDTTCVGTIEDVTYADCYDELGPEVLESFRCSELTPEQEALVNDCINGILSNDCITMADLDAYTAALERGEDPEWPVTNPPECEALEEVFRPCG